MKAAIQQGGIAGAADLATQWNLVEAGVQDKTDWRRTLGVVAGSVPGAIAPHINAHAKGERIGIAPEGAPKQQTPEVKLDEPAPVAARSDAPDGVMPDVSGPPVPKGEDLVSSVPTSSEAKTVLPQEASTPPVIGEQGLGLSGVPGQQTPVPPGVLKQGPPLGVRGQEPAPVASQKQAEGQVDERVSSSSGELSPSPPKFPREWDVDLDRHEFGKKGHTLDKHVYITIQGLFDRVNIEGKELASRFLSKLQAVNMVQLATDKHTPGIKVWLADPKNKAPFIAVYGPSVGDPSVGPIGEVLKKGASTLVPGTGVKVVLRKDANMPEGFRIVTSHPIL